MRDPADRSLGRPELSYGSWRMRDPGRGGPRRDLLANARPLGQDGPKRNLLVDARPLGRGGPGRDNCLESSHGSWKMRGPGRGKSSSCPGRGGPGRNLLEEARPDSRQRLQLARGGSGRGARRTWARAKGKRSRLGLLDALLGIGATYHMRWISNPGQNDGKVSMSSSRDVTPHHTRGFSCIVEHKMLY
ncbi:hypothetical protein Salat_2050400 [Sesamum alatum]|uniref:Uncharacterized protein n=1 Tax=Sesamum alatum TaxID=300844 RepID=A0AAE1XZT8_9LAMI|nr:hypothetical protein Salat_2050400 [Sesamum alatum]